MGGSAVQRVDHLLGIAGRAHAFVQHLERLARVYDRRRKTALVAGIGGQLSVAGDDDLHQRHVTFAGHAHGLAEARRAHRHADEFLKVEIVGGEAPAVDQVDHGHREHARVGAQVAVQGKPQAGCSAAGSRERDADDGVGAQRALAGRAVKVVEKLVEADLVGHVESSDSRRDRLFDRADGAFHVHATVAWPAVADLHGLTTARGAARRHVGAPARVAHPHVDLHSGKATTVEDPAGGHLRDQRAPAAPASRRSIMSHAAPRFRR